MTAEKLPSQASFRADRDIEGAIAAGRGARANFEKHFHYHAAGDA